MKQLRKQLIVKWMALLLVLLLFRGNLSFSMQEEPGGQEEHLNGLFRWAKMDYQAGKYREVVKTLELMLSYYDEESEVDEQKSKPKDKLLKGKIYLLLGAAHEQLRRINKAKENYRLSTALLENQNMQIEGIDLDYLVEYQRIIMKKKKPEIVTPAVIEKPVPKPKKKRISPLLIIAGVVLIGGIIAALVLKKKRSTDIEVDANYDTRVLGIEWVQIPAGEFMMGDNFNEGDFDEQPVHAVHLDQYYISKYEVTFEQYDKYCDETGRPRPIDNGWGRGDRPVINIDWGDANSFCEWLSQKTTKLIHLPTEAQWEKAARGTDQRRYPWGSSAPDCNKTNYNNCYGQTRSVGSHPAGVSPYGIHDMAGNVSEWCLDEYYRSFYAGGSYNNPVRHPDYLEGWIYYVIRGGSWEESTVRSADRDRGRIYWGSTNYFSSHTRSSALGFRLVLERN